MTQFLNIFNNIKSLNIYFIESHQSYLIEKTNLPHLKTLTVKKSRDLRWFKNLNSLKNLSIEILEEITDIEEVINPIKLVFL